MVNPGLCEIVLGGFRTFEELTRIPIRRLTLLFGPNSSGKSSLEDGIRLLDELCGIGDPKEFDQEPLASFDSHYLSRRARLQRVWRRTGEASESYVPLMQIGASTLIDEWACLGEDILLVENGTYNPPSPGLHRLDLSIRLRDKGRGLKGSKGVDFVLRDVVFSLDGVPYLELTEHAEAALNFSHPLLSSLPMPDGCRLAERSRPDHVSTKAGWVRFRGMMTYDEKKRLDQRTYQEGWRWNDVEGLKCEETWPPPPEMINGLSCFAEVFDRILQNSCQVVSRSLKPYTVPASRTTPEHRELVFIFGEDAGYEITVHGDPRYRSLASSFIVSLDADNSPHGEKLHQTINRMLTGHLFREYGYQLTADSRQVSGRRHFADRLTLASDATADPHRGDEARLVAIHLEDPHGRQLAFTEVGSGLGYVLPVLAAACDKSLPVVILQQPELHLHPALQAQLGDVFVEMSREERRMIIETHSQHLLLRVLKRLRQSGNATGIDPELHIEPSDVAILYFEPQPSGTTKVKLLRVSADGEFLDRWPRGFFTERDEELFDE